MKKNNKSSKSVKERATKRLMRDLVEIQKNPLPHVSALPVEKPSNLFLWHANIKGPSGTPWEGGIFHMVLRFPFNYPDKPPTLTLCTRIEHPCVKGNTVCLDLLEVKEGAPSDGFVGWSPTYSVQSILIALQAFLFESSASRVLANIADPKQYNQKKEEWLSGVKWSVEQSLNYQDKSVGHHPPRKPFPPFPTEQSLTEVKKLTKLDLAKQSLSCFYTKQNFTEDCMGVGISYSKNLRTGEIKSINSPLDIVSLRAFMNHKLRSSSTNQRFSHWLPIYINQEHGKKAMYLAERAISIICTGSHQNFKPEMVLLVFPKLLSTMVVEVMSGKKHASLKSLYGYCQFHRLFIEFVSKYPKIGEECEKRIKEFISDEKLRHKDVCPNLGEFFPLLSVTKYQWKDIRDAYLKESFIRNAFWILNKRPDFDPESPDGKKAGKIDEDERISESFKLSKVSQRFLYFHVWFLKNVSVESKSNKELAEEYDSNFGNPTVTVEDTFINACEKINNLETYEEFFKGIGVDKTKKEIHDLLLSSIENSRKKGYHGAQSSSVLTPEEFAKKNKVVDLEALLENGKLMNDEKKWKEMSELRWGLYEVPEYLHNSKYPWKSLYLQNNCQDLITNLNEVPNFTRLHRTLELSADSITTLEILMFSPTNIKSKYFWLTSVVTKLTKLETLIIRKGETSLGVKGFKALLKGLANNPGCLSSLILEHCGVDADSIKELTKGKLVSKNLTKISLKGNPLGDSGAVNLSEFLCKHDMLPHLTHLDLSDCKIGNIGASAIAEALLVKKDLKNLKMIKNPFSVGLESLVKNLSYNPNIEELDISKVTGSFANGGHDSLGKLIKLTVSLKSLNLWKITGLSISDEVFLRLKNNKTLKKLDLAETRFDKFEKLGEALAENRVLETLELEGNGIKGDHIHQLLEKIKKVKDGKFSLKELNLSSNSLSVIDNLYPQRKKSIGNLLKIATNLLKLNLSKCFLTRDQMVTIGEALSPQYKLPLLELNLSRNNLVKNAIKPLVDGLQNNTVLKKLDLSGNLLGVLGGNLIASVIEKNKGLETLNLFGCFIEIEGGISVIKALESNKSLKNIDLGLNRIRSRGALQLVKTLPNNSTIERLGLKFNHIPDTVGVKIIQTVVESKNNINYIALAGNFLSVSMRSEISSKLLKAQKKIEFDLSKLVEVKDPERQERTVYLTPLPMDTTEQQIKNLFYSNSCGVCLSVSLHTHKVKSGFATAKYAFVEFAHPDSVNLAMQLVHKGKNKIYLTEVRIVRAGVQNKEEAERKSTNTTVSRGVSRGRGRGRGGFRGGSARGFSGGSGRGSERGSERRAPLRKERPERKVESKRG